MPLTIIKTAPKTEQELEAELRPGDVRVKKDTKVIALELGYSDCLREPGEVFIIKKGTIYRPGYTWFKPVDEDVATTEEEATYEDMTVPELKKLCAERDINFAGINKKPDLIALLTKADSEDSLA